MRLLFDQMLSPLLANRLADLFPESVHTDHVSLGDASDSDIWLYARANRMTIVTKDRDYEQLVLQRRFPPKVIKVEIGNAKTSAVESLIRANSAAILAFEVDETKGVLYIG